MKMIMITKLELKCELWFWIDDIVIGFELTLLIYKVFSCKDVRSKFLGVRLLAVQSNTQSRSWNGHPWNMISCTFLPLSQLHDIAENTACTQMKGDINRYVLNTNSPLCGIVKPRYRQNNKGYQILRIGY